MGKEIPADLSKLANIERVGVATLGRRPKKISVLPNIEDNTPIYRGGTATNETSS